jgi:hypothetical protein
LEFCLMTFIGILIIVIKQIYLQFEFNAKAVGLNQILTHIEAGFNFKVIEVLF